MSKGLCPGGVEKSSVNSAFKVIFSDPKPGELIMARVNPREIEGEARTREPFNTLG